MIGKLKRKVVVPGDKIGVIEEYIPYNGTYEHNSEILSSLAGFLEEDLEKHTVSVKTMRRILLPKPGDVVYAVVVSTSEKSASVMIISINNKLLNNYFSGLIQIRSSSMDSMKSIRSALKPGDMVKCEVLGYNNDIYHLRMHRSEFGVVYALCTKCGGVLVRSGKELKCQICNNIENRKIANDYGIIRLG
ncbi:exosome complex RNA-binding protein Csl4 [Candidatus Bathyarchaeota archaeon]|nr:exosome complex RNA-binding protein Csl4 [Candidatus Bathyarchaeota archaeon]MBS7613568.1 exosome complex RNA-binding protein Csl4 [Candidatus Bathyarchaeota archaeon]MBS7618615.1 exosome complex RNA-binding protein Csl4 [Candidatus Bathyarchaeota archaeon]